jgi:hypothetical protein
MRTNALLLSVALAAGSTAMAQGTFSQNIVGYVNKTVPADSLVMISNPLNNGGNTVEEVIKTDGSLTLFHFIGGNFVSSESLDGEWIDGGDIVIAPGGGFYATSTGGEAATITFVGEVAVGGSVEIPGGLSIASSVLPQAGELTDLMYPAGTETIFQFINGNFVSADAFDGEFLGDIPNVQVAESFWVLNDEGAKTWERPDFTL